MNVSDFDDVEIPEGDMLRGIFEAQRLLMDKYHDIEKKRGALVVEPDMFGNIDHRFVQMRLKDLAWRVTEELAESMGTLKNRPWKQSEVPTDKVHMYEELGDFLHFAIELFITAGMTSEDLAKVYHRKNAVNQFRIRSEY